MNNQCKLVVQRKEGRIEYNFTHVVRNLPDGRTVVEPVTDQVWMLSLGVGEKRGLERIASKHGVWIRRPAAFGLVTGVGLTMIFLALIRFLA